MNTVIRQCSKACYCSVLFCTVCINQCIDIYIYINSQQPLHLKMKRFRRQSRKCRDLFVGRHRIGVATGKRALQTPRERRYVPAGTVGKKETHHCDTGAFSMFWKCVKHVLSRIPIKDKKENERGSELLTTNGSSRQNQTNTSDVTRKTKRTNFNNKTTDKHTIHYVPTYQPDRQMLNIPSTVAF